MVGGFSAVPYPVEQLGIGADVHARRDLIGGNACQCRGRHDAHRFQRHAVERRAQELEADLLVPVIPEVLACGYEGSIVGLVPTHVGIVARSGSRAGSHKQALCCPLA